MIHISRSKRKSWDEYVRSVFLSYIANHPNVNQVTYFPTYFQRELNIADSYSYFKKQLKKGFLVREKKDVMRLSEKGREAVKDEYIRFFDAVTPYLSFFEYIEEKERMGDRESVELTMLSALLKKLQMLKNENNYIGVKDVHLDVAQLYEKAEIADQAMYHYLVSLYYDISGLEYYDDLILYARGKRKREQCEKAFCGICIRPEVMQGILRLKEVYDPRMVHDIFEREQIRINLCTERRMQMLAEDLCNGTYDYSSWRKYFEKNYRSMLQYTEEYRKENGKNGKR